MVIKNECRFCGWKDGSKQYVQNRNGVCYCCAFWLPFIKERGADKFARFKGLHYTLLGDLEFGLRHFPGSIWEFEFMDGRVITATNVTCQGAIPPRFGKELPNNVRKLRTTWRWPEHHHSDFNPGPGWGNPMYDDEEPDPIVTRVMCPVFQGALTQGGLFD